MGDHGSIFNHPDLAFGVYLAVTDQGDITGKHPHPVGVDAAPVGLDHHRRRSFGIGPRDTDGPKGLFGKGAEITRSDFLTHHSPSWLKGHFIYHLESTSL